MRYYDGSAKWSAIENALNRDGYRCEFTCTYGTYIPEGFDYTGRETGWEMRRKIKQWCKKNGVTDYQIIRNTSYHRDLHGPRVYELWARTPTTQDTRP